MRCNSFLSYITPAHSGGVQRFSRGSLGKDEGFVLDDEVALQYFRLQQISSGPIDLSDDEADSLKGSTDVGTAGTKGEEVTLSSLIECLNERFGTDFNKADGLLFEQVRTSAENNENITEAARANNFADFGASFNNALDDLFIARMEDNEEIFSKYMEDKKFCSCVCAIISREVFNQVRKNPSAQ